MAKKQEPSRSAPVTPKPVSGLQLTIKLRRDAKCGQVELLRGAKLAEVTLHPGVDLNYLIDAIRGGLASEVDLDIR